MRPHRGTSDAIRPDHDRHSGRARRHRDPNLLSRLAYTTVESTLNPGDTLDITSGAMDSSTLAALLLVEHARFKVLDCNAGLLLCVGITADELAFVRVHGHTELLNKLKSAGVYPYTEPFRKSVLQ